MGLTHSDICSGCTGNVSDIYIHALWHCTPVQMFWQKIREDRSTWLRYPIPASPSPRALGDLSNNDSGLFIAKKTVLFNWKTKGKK